MSQMINTTPLSAPISPGGDDENTFGTHYAEFGIGGFQKVTNLTERDAISVHRRMEKVVFVEEDGKFYHFKDTSWVEIPIAGSGGSSMTTEEVQDIIGKMIQDGSHESASIIYDDTTGTLHLRMHGGSPTVTYVDPNHVPGETPADGSFGKPFLSLNAARDAIKLTGPSVVCMTGGDIQGVHDFRGFDMDINIFAPLAPIAGSFLVDRDYNKKITITGLSVGATCNVPEALEIKEFTPAGVFHVTSQARADDSFVTDGSVHVMHKNTNRIHTAFNEVSWKSYERDGSFTYPAEGMKFYTKNRRVAWLLAGVTSETEWDAIVDHDTEDYTKWPLATHVTVGSGNTAAIEDHGYDESTGLYNVNIWYDNGKPETKANIEKWLSELTYPETNTNQDSGNLYVHGDAFITGTIHNENLIHNVQNIKPKQPKVAVEATLGRDYSIPYVNPYGSLLSFGNIEFDISQSFTSGELVAPYTGAYYVKLHLESDTLAVSGGDEFRIEFIRKNPSATQHEYLVDAQSGVWKTRAIVTELNKPFIIDEEFVTILEKGETMEVRIVNLTTTPAIVFRGGVSSPNKIIIDSNNASMLDYSKLRRDVDNLMKHLEFDPNWKLVLNQNGKVIRRRIV